MQNCIFIKQNNNKYYYKILDVHNGLIVNVSIIFAAKHRLKFIPKDNVMLSGLNPAIFQRYIWDSSNKTVWINYV